MGHGGAGGRPGLDANGDPEYLGPGPKPASRLDFFCGVPLSATDDRRELRDLLSQRSPHGIVHAAHEVRRRIHGSRTTFVANAHLDCSPAGLPWCPLTGEMAPDGGFARRAADLPEVATQTLVLFGSSPTSADLEAGWAETTSADPSTDPPTTLQLGCATDWARIYSGDDRGRRLEEWRRRGLSVISDGVRPGLHPAFGEESASEWSAFWQAAAAAGIRGQATVLYGPGHDLDAVFAQIDAIDRLQSAVGVFDGVSPVVYLDSAFGGPEDALSTQSTQDLRVLAACRLALPTISHLRLLYDRGDLKSAHTALLCGVDDLEGHLFLGARDRKAEVESEDLSLAEMSRWLEEVGFEARLRNGLYQSRPVPMQSSAESS